jgi:predicted phage-related endonuclease
MMTRHQRTAALVDRAFEVQAELLEDKSLSPSLKLKVSQDVLDRGGFPKFSASTSLNTTRVIDSVDLEHEREQLLTEYKEIEKKIERLQEGGSVGNDVE